jgi:hypothetical protein
MTNHRKAFHLHRAVFVGDWLAPSSEEISRLSRIWIRDGLP